MLYVYHTSQSCAACLETHKCGVSPWSGVRCRSPLGPGNFASPLFFGAGDRALAREEKGCAAFSLFSFFFLVEKRAAASHLGDMSSLLRDIK